MEALPSPGRERIPYYFGFEDLWRGGDNDFEDMLIRVKGLIQPCTPTTELCNGLDDNCDGLVDNDPADAGGECTELDRLDMRGSQLHVHVTPRWSGIA